MITSDPGKPNQSEGGTARRPLSKELQVAVFRRDGWLCCWCKRPVIFPPVMKFLERELRTSGSADRLAYYHANWTRHGAPLLDLLGAVIDHIEAFSAGGTDHIDNLATACNKCNGRKGAATLDDWHERPIEKPVKGKYGEPQNWDGFSSLFVMLAQRDAAALTASERGWFRALRPA
jgi:5-methylcytosine-specific restriction endonuclease McrA